MSTDEMLRPKARWLGRHARTASPPPLVTERDTIEAVLEHAHVIGRGPASEHQDRGTWLLIWVSDPIVDWLTSYRADGDDDGGVDADTDGDGESDADTEPSMGSIGQHDQRRWSAGDRTDMEEQCEGEGEQCDDDYDYRDCPLPNRYVAVTTAGAAEAPLYHPILGTYRRLK